jgi:hypothetical protein
VDVGRVGADLRGLPTPMRVEVAYAIQRRVDEQVLIAVSPVL